MNVRGFCWLVLSAIFLTPSCMTEEERNNIVRMACSEAEATRIFESARRVRLVNEARLELDIDVYPFPSYYLDFQLMKGKCSDTILKYDYSEVEEVSLDVRTLIDGNEIFLEMHTAGCFDSEGNFQLRNCR